MRMIKIFTGHLIDIDKIAAISEPKFDQPFDTCFGFRTCSFTILFGEGGSFVCERKFTIWRQGNHHINKQDDPTMKTEMVWDSCKLKYFYRLIDGSLVDEESFNMKDFKMLLGYQNIMNEYNNLISLL